MNQRIKKILPFLRCPKTNTKLTLSDGKLVSTAGFTYPIVNGKPVLVINPQDYHLNPPSEDKISQNITNFNVPEFIKNPNSRILHLGSGNVPSDDPRVISLDVLPCQYVDVVAEVEILPFSDDAFDYIESGAVFEHLYNPLKAIQEVKRVTKPLGLFRIDTAFMQSYHGFPQHYFNMTPQAIETFLVDDFILEESYVPDRASPLMSIVSLIERFISYLPKDEANEILNLSVKEMIGLMKSDLGRKSRLLSSYSEYAINSMAASYVVLARKPENWSANNENIDEEGDILKRNYYTLRQEILQRHHEVELYKRFSIENGYTRNENITTPDGVHTILSRCKVQDPTSIANFEKSINIMREEEVKLRQIRDKWINIYLAVR